MQTLSEENYLKAIWKLVGVSGGTVNTNAIAASVNTRAASVTDMLKKLSDKSLIDYVPYKGVSLTKKGKQAAMDVVRKHRLWEVFLVEKLGFGWDEVHDIAEQLEHIHSEELIEKLDRFLGFPKTDPHGDPIPDKHGRIQEPAGTPLAGMAEQKHIIVTGVADHSSAFLQFLDRNNIRLGSKLVIHEVTEYDRSLDLSINGKKLHISHDVARNILVKKSAPKRS